jgi:hypothetical protein
MLPSACRKALRVTSKAPGLHDPRTSYQILVSVVQRQSQSFHSVLQLRETAIGTSLPSNEQLAMVIHILKERIQFVQHLRVSRYDKGINIRFISKECATASG